MQFRLLYSGQLLGASRTDTRASLKHAIRCELSPQLKRLWETNRNLIAMAAFRAQNWSESHPGQARKELRPHLPSDEAENWAQEELAMLGKRWVAENWERSGQGYIPLATAEMDLRCSLEILFLRPEEPGLIIKGGDLDNRLKTLFDALRLPQSAEEAGGKNGNKASDEPIYCLLEDDRLISEIRIVTDHLLLLPHTKEFHANDVFLVIDVKFVAHCCPAIS